MSSSQDSVSRTRRIVDDGELPPRLGPYDVEGEIGAGAMGVVYRAHDPRLDRTVALKALPPAFAEDSERLARFEREARMLAALHHPHVASLHGLEEHDGRRYLVMEFVAGETLGERIARGDLDLQEALELAEQIASGLAAAHDAGIIHRDLKPGNVLVTPDGRAKVVDFGLAKDVAPRQGGSGPGASSALARRLRADEITRVSSVADSDDESSHDDYLGPTVLADSDASPSAGSSGDPIATEPGAILGTAAYMSPEQARGRPLDRRTDVWSFGCVLFEMLSRRRPFRGDSLMQTLVAVLQQEPDWTLLPPDVPPTVRRLLERCLRKDRRERLRDLGDAALELRELRSGTWSAREFALGASTPVWRKAPVLVPALLAALAVVLAVTLGLWLVRGGAGSNDRRPAVPVRLDLELPGPLFLGDQGSIRWSPDGRTLAWVGLDPVTNVTRIHVRAIDSFESKILEGTEGANGLFFSPDGRQIAFFVPHENALERIAVSGASSVFTVSRRIPGGSKGGTWLDDDTLVIGYSFAGGLAAVPAAGGEIEMLTEPGPAVKTHRFPRALPGGRRVLFTESGTDVDTFDQARLRVLDLDTREIETVFEGGSDGSLVLASGRGGWLPGAAGPQAWLLFAHSGALMSLPVELDSLRPAGSPSELVSGVLVSNLSGFGLYDHSGDVLVYAPGDEDFEACRLVQVGRDGSRRVLDVPPRAYRLVRVSPDGERAVLHIDSATGDLWTLDFARGALSRLTSRWDNMMPIWSPDGRVAYNSNRDDRPVAIYLQAPDGTAKPERYHQGLVFPEAWTPDGAWLVASVARPDSAYDLVAIPPAGGEMRTLVATPAVEFGAELSKDGWMVYVSNETGSFEIYLRRWDQPAPRLQVSIAGGEDPVFSAAGDEILFRQEDEILSVPFDPEGPTLGVARVAFRGIDLPAGGPPDRIWDLMADGSVLYPEPLFDPSRVETLRVMIGLRDELIAASGGD